MRISHLSGSGLLLAALWGAPTPGQSPTQNPPSSPAVAAADTSDEDEAALSRELDSLADHPGTGSSKGSGVAVVDTEEDDQPFENALEPEEDLRKKWSLALGYSRSDESDVGTVTHWTTSVSRNWQWGDWTPSLDLGWDRTGYPDSRTHQGWVGAGLSWDFSEAFAWLATANWYPEWDGSDGASAGTGLSWWGDWGEHLTPNASINGSWDRFSRGDFQAAIGLSPSWEHTGGSLSGWYDHQYLSYLNALGNPRSEYTGVWGWSLDWALKVGNWSSGPAWSGDYTKVNTTASGRALVGGTRVKLPKISSTGVLVNQEFLWNVTWKPLTGISLSVDLFKTTGIQTTTAKSGATQLQKATLARWSKTTELPQDSKGVRSSLTLTW